MPTDRELVDAGWAELTKTTDPYPTWKKKGFPKDSHWQHAKDNFDQVGKGSTTPPTTPPSTGSYPTPPNVTAAVQSQAKWERDVTHPVEITNVHVSGAPDYGVAVMGYFPNPPVSPSAYKIHDVIGEKIGKTPPVMNGTGEAGLWIGAQADVLRAVGDGSWMGLWTGCNCFGSTFTDVKATSKGVGAYLEHDTKNCVFKRCEFYGETDSINVEWWYGGHGSSGCTFDQCRIYCPKNNWGGFFLDAGNYGFKFLNCEFWGPGPIGFFPKNLVDPSKPNFIDMQSCTFKNDGAREVQYHDHGIG